MGGLSEDFKELTLDSDVFEEAKITFEEVMQRLLKNMTDSKSSAGSVTLKIDVELITTDAGTKAEKVIIPSFEYKVNSQMAIKNEEKGISNPNMELVFDADKKEYILQSIDGTEQPSIWDVNL